MLEKILSRFCRNENHQLKDEQEIYLNERQRIGRIEERISKLKTAPPNETNQREFSPLRRVKRTVSFDPLRCHSQVLLDEMHFRFRNNPAVSERRNAMGHSMHRKSLVKGILSMSRKGEPIPNNQLKEGKKIPLYLAGAEHSVANANQPLPELDQFYDNKTYIVLNKQGTLFRFNKAKSLFLLDSNNSIRKAAVRLFIAPFFAHFITFVILCNCACMVMVEPPSWIENYLEYIFTAIYIAEAAIKIIARGFVLHSFSYLRDPWNWLDFIVIMTALVTEIMKASFSQDMFAKVAVLRAFRVLRALKTMSIVPGLRAIVKALLRSIRALKHAVLLTIFCVSVFGLVGYQLFHGTLRQKCVRVPGSLEISPDSLYVKSLRNLHDLRLTESFSYSNNSSNWTLMFTNWLVQNRNCALKPTEPQNPFWSKNDSYILGLVVNKTDINSLQTGNDSRCFEESFVEVRDQKLASSSFGSFLNFTTTMKTNRNEANANKDVHVNITMTAANISCINETENETWMHLIRFGRYNVPRWKTRQFVVIFRFDSVPTSSNQSRVFLYYTEMNWTEITNQNLFHYWLDSEGNQCKVEPKTGLFFPPGSPDRPLPEPIYCSSNESSECPSGYTCLQAGSNPDNGYTSFDHFFLAFLTSFRLVSLDAWSRLYYLTLHTAGPTYAIFYLVVVFLGSYYLVNLILAVVYMAYEEQQAVVDEEEVAAKEREEEEREFQKDHSNCSGSVALSTDSSESSEEDEEPDRRMGLITTSLGPNMNSISRGSRRRKFRHLSQPNVRLTGTDYLTRDGLEISGRNRLGSPVHQNLRAVMSDCSDRSTESRRRMDYLSGSNFEISNNRKKSRRLSTPLIKLSLTSPRRASHKTEKHPYLTNSNYTNVYQNYLAPPREFHRSCVIDESEEDEKDKDKEFSFLIPQGRLSESSSDEADEKNSDTAVVVDLEIEKKITSVSPSSKFSYNSNNKSHRPEDQALDDLKSNHNKTTPKVVKRKNVQPTSTGSVSKDPQKMKKEKNKANSDKEFCEVPLIKVSNSQDALSNISTKPGSTKGDNNLTTSIESLTSSYVEVVQPHTNRKKKRKKISNHKYYRQFINVFVKWKCLPSNLLPVQTTIREIILNPFTDLIITICIALNALFLSIESYPMNDELKSQLENANLFFTLIFTVEMAAKIIGLSPYTYFKQKWNVFDAVVVLFSLLEYFVQTSGGFSVLRAFRLMRIIKLAKQWPILNKLLRIIGKTLGKLSHLTLVFLLVLYIFAVVGMQLLHKQYYQKFEGNLPRWNFIDFPHAFMVVFRIQCGEWVENMFTCLNVAHPGICIPLFITVYLIGNLVILNLFLALLLNSFSGDVLQQTTSDNNSISEAIKCVKSWVQKHKKKFSSIPSSDFCKLLKRRFKNHPVPESANDDQITKLRDIEMNLIHDENEDSHELATNGKHKNLEHSSRTEEIAIFAHLDGGLITAAQHQLLNSTSNSCSGEVEKLSRSCSVYSGNSDWSNHSGFIHRSRRSSRRSIREIQVKARERYRGMSSSVDVRNEDSVSGLRSRTNSVRLADSVDDKKTKSNQESQESLTEETENAKKEMEPCLPCINNCFFDHGCFLRIRKFTYSIVTHTVFEYAVIFCILLSSVALAMDDIYLKKRLVFQKILKIAEIFFCVFFAIEMLLKWIGLGWKKYFTNYWCLLDCVLVWVSIINLSVSTTQANLGAFKALRTFRALRPLRALSRFKGMKVVVDALVRAIPPILNVFFVCMMFWLIFGILGVNLFGGKFGRCVSLNTGDILPLRVGPNETEGFRKFLSPTNFSLEEQCSTNNTDLIKYLNRELKVGEIDPSKILPAVSNKSQCIKCSMLLNRSDILWNIPSVNFDSVPKAYLALLQLATFNGWMEIMTPAVDATGVEQQPHYEASFYNYLYFCVFIIFGAFFSLNLFIGVIIDNFNQQKIKQKGSEDGVFLTDEQRHYYNAVKKIASTTPKKPVPRPRNKFSNKVYDLVTDRRFEMAIMLLIMLNLVVMAIEHYGMPKELEKLLENFNFAIICIFLVEAILKIIGLRYYYFKIYWNIFDILVVIVSFASIYLSDIMSSYFVQPTLFRIIRLFRVTRILRLIREAKGIRTLLFALMMSLPALFNIGSLLFLLMSIYAIIGMSQFPYVQKISGIDDILNFETFPNSLLILFQMSTSEGWDKFIDPVLLDEAPYCNPNPPDGTPSNCGSPAFGVFFFATYVIISFLIVVNMYIAVILENFEVATRENAEPLTADDFEQFFEVWQKYDDRLTQFIKYDQLSCLLDELDDPLRIPAPNRAFIALSEMKLSKDGKVHFIDVIIALVKKVLGDSPELADFKEKMKETFLSLCPIIVMIDEKELISSVDFTSMHRSAVIIQRAFRQYREGKKQKRECERIQAEIAAEADERFKKGNKNKTNNAKESSS